MNLSTAESLALLPEAERKSALASLTEAQCEELLWDWRFWARPAQQVPQGDWLTWLILSGRGWGKTRTGSETIREWVCGTTPLSGGLYGRIALVAETAADARDVMVEGESGLLAVHPPAFRPNYEPSKRRLTWPNGAVATLFNAVEPDQLRGPQFDAAWCDELAKWRYAQETWDMLQFGLRLGSHPRQVVTTTPRPISVIKELIQSPTTVVTRGSTSENQKNLAPSFLAQIRARYQGTRLGRQELDAEILEDNPNALWTRALIDQALSDKAPELVRVVVAIDPSGSGGEEGATETGIVVAGKGVDGVAYVLADETCADSPAGWGSTAVKAYHAHQANLLVGEVNFGGAMVQHVVQTVDPAVPFRMVTASRGKWLRAEPIAALYQQGRVKHVGGFAKLEDEMCAFGPDGLADGKSPNRLDALVWAMTELMVGGGSMVYDAPASEVVIQPIDIPSHWPRCCAVDLEWQKGGALWAAFDRSADTIYLYAEYSAGRGDLAVHADAVRKRGSWIPALVSQTPRKARDDVQGLIDRLVDQNINLFTVDFSPEQAVGEVAQRLSGKRIKVFSTLTGWLGEYRAYRRNDKGELPAENDHLMRCMGLLAMYGADLAINEQSATATKDDVNYDDARNGTTGY